MKIIESVAFPGPAMERLKDLYGVEPGQPEDREVFGRDYLVPAGILNQHGRVLSIVEPMPGDRLE
jgi:hypothetical protein